MNSSAFLQRLSRNRRGDIVASRSTFEQRQRRAIELMKLPNDLLDVFRVVEVMKLTDLLDIVKSKPVRNVFKRHGFVDIDGYSDRFESSRLGLIAKIGYLLRKKPPYRAVPTYFATSKPDVNSRYILFQPIVSVNNIVNANHPVALDRYRKGNEFGGDPHLGNYGIYLDELVVFDW